jgi:hypothetical protein
MLSDKSYARYFGQSLLEEILHLDEELSQAIANKQDPAVEEELERSLDVALSDADVVAKNILEEVKKPKVHVKSEYEKELDTMMEAALAPGKKAKSKGPSCPDCGAGVKQLSFHPFDFGQSSETGYHDAGERYHCHKCNSKGDADDVK